MWLIIFTYDVFYFLYVDILLLSIKFLLYLSGISRNVFKVKDSQSEPVYKEKICNQLHCVGVGISSEMSEFIAESSVFLLVAAESHDSKGKWLFLNGRPIAMKDSGMFWINSTSRGRRKLIHRWVLFCLQSFIKSLRKGSRTISLTPEDI